jgi:uncharacterized membrane protein
VLGLNKFFLKVARKQGPEFTVLFDGFSRFAVALGTYLLIALFVFLWSLLLIVPGVIAALSYSLAFYLLVDNENIGAMDAIKRSKELMNGYKWKLFCLGWRFFGWALLCILTLGIGFLWLGPYMATSMALFYEDVMKQSGGPATAATEAVTSPAPPPAAPPPAPSA